jgi:hypothetical protein
MPITLKLNGGIEIHVEDGDFEALREAFEAALAQNKPFQIRNPNGSTLVVNPHNVLYFEGPSRAANPAGNGAVTARPIPA